jgi:hypothetical protein
MARIKLTRTARLTLFFLRIYLIALLVLLVVKFIKVL